MDSRNGRTPGTSPPSAQIRIERPQDDATIYFRALSSEIGGLWTHWSKDHSVYCHPSSCYPACHRKRRDWKGYVAAQIWDDEHQAWIPCVLEMTAYIEADVRRLWKRGQVWVMSRGKSTKEKNAPTVATLFREDDPNTLPAAFDVLPILRRVFGANVENLKEKNPMPGRVYGEVSLGDSPIPKEPEITPEQIEANRAKMRAAGVLPAERHTRNGERPRV